MSAGRVLTVLATAVVSAAAGPARPAQAEPSATAAALGSQPAARASQPASSSDRGGIASLPDGSELMRRMQARPDSDTRVDRLRIELHDHEGGIRVRKARLLRKIFTEDTRTLFVFDAPANIAGTALLTLDYDDTDKEDARWLYLPAMRKTRRVSAAQRTEGFMGGDFSYEDIRNEARLRPEDYHVRTVGSDSVEGRACVLAEATPKNPDVGYARLELCVDASIWIPLRFVMYDVDGVRSKTVTMSDLREERGIWTAYRRVARNEVNGHSTVVVSETIDRDLPLRDSLFTEGALARGGR